MRSDFSKILTERPRRGGLYAYKTVRRRTKAISEDDRGNKEGMRWPYGYNQKEFSDLIGPLWRFLQSRIGSKWNDVYSEICETIKGRNTTQQYLLDHVDQYVGLGPWGRWSDFSVDDSGILTMSPQRKRARMPSSQTLKSATFIKHRQGAHGTAMAVAWAVASSRPAIPTFASGADDETA